MDFDSEYEDGIDDGIDLTPVIDVLFLLLIFFIMTTTFAKPVINVMLPSAESGSSGEQRPEMIIVIDEAGQIFHEKEIVARENVAGLMQMKKELPINFQVDQKAPFDSVMLVIDKARMAGRKDFVFTTEKTNVAGS